MFIRLLQRLFGRSSKPRERYALERFEGDFGRGLVIRRLSDDQKLRWRSLAKSSGLLAFKIAGVSHYEEQLQHKSFAPGKMLALIPEPDNPQDPNAIAVYNERQTKQSGYVPKHLTQDVKAMLEAEEPPDCLSMWEALDDGRRAGLRVLIVESDVNVYLP